MKPIPTILLILCFAVVTIGHAYFASAKIATLERRVGDLQKELHAFQAEKSAPTTPAAPPRQVRNRIRTITNK